MSVSCKAIRLRKVKPWPVAGLLLASRRGQNCRALFDNIPTRCVERERERERERPPFPPPHTTPCHEPRGPARRGFLSLSLSLSLVLSHSLSRLCNTWLFCVQDRLTSQFNKNTFPHLFISLALFLGLKFKWETCKSNHHADDFILPYKLMV